MSGQDHHELSFWEKYVFSTDHKTIGIQYGITALLFMLAGFGLMLLMRWQLAYPFEAIPAFKSMFSFDRMPDGVMTGEFYNGLGAMHGTIMIFLGVVPMGVGALGNYVLPLQIGAVDMAFPKINMMSYHSYFWGGVLMLLSFLAPGGPANTGWTAYPPLSVLSETSGQTMWLFSMVFLITSSLLGSLNFIVTTVQLRAKGMSYFRMPIFVWAQLVTSFLLLLAFPPLEAAAVLQLMDRLAGTSFFMASGLYVGGEAIGYAGGGSALLYQHLFWFLGHPEVYVLILPALGTVAEIIAVNTRKPLYGYTSLVYSMIFLGFMSMIVWAHHMYMTGMGSIMSAFFQTTTMIISVPSVVILACMMLSLWGGSIRFNTPMLFALGFLPMFGIGGLTGLPLGLAATDITLHDTYYVIGHFHYVVAPGTIFALFAAVYFWYPKATGRMMNEFWGKIHFFGSFVCMNLIFFPMLIQGLAGMNRRVYDGGAMYQFNAEVLHLNYWILVGGLGLAVFQIPFILNFFLSIKRGQKVGANPWDATTIEWADAPSPPPHGNFLKEIVVHRGPYEYSVPGDDRDYIPQTQA
ncbi:MAG: cbb3-type cytochrome c oxidase subunit I [Oligoflexales bacterium]